ncbi:hypothetical protein MMC06_001551 [Schaereria dolodes]|nr:hypothetical protein [Schaereria dolodes]
MSTRDAVPDAWDDDWVSRADSSNSTSEPARSTSRTSKAERRAQQAELNRKLWEEAEAPGNPYIVDTRNNVPLKSEFKPAVKVLSRKPTPTVVARKDPGSGFERLTIEDEDDDDEEDAKRSEITIEERQLKAQREREEKQKKYEEVRERLFGVSNTTAGNSPGSVAPLSSRPFGDTKTKSRNKGGRESRPSSSGGKTRQLYDPNYNAKPDSIYVQKQESQAAESGRSTPVEEQIIRNPRGPDGSGRGGFGFTHRGGKV